MPAKTGGPPAPVVVPIAGPSYVESLTDLYGLVYAVLIIGSDANYFTITRKVDWLSPQLAKAAASNRTFTSGVRIHTHSGHLVGLSGYARVDQITKAGQWPALYGGTFPGSLPVPAGMEAITWAVPGAAIWVDGDLQGNSYNWRGLNS